MAHVVHSHWCVRSQPANSCGRPCGYVAMGGAAQGPVPGTSRPGPRDNPASLHATKAPGFDDVEIHHHAGVARLFRGVGLHLPPRLDVEALPGLMPHHSGLGRWLDRWVGECCAKSPQSTSLGGTGWSGPPSRPRRNRRRLARPSRRRGRCMMGIGATLARQRALSLSTVGGREHREPVRRAHGRRVCRHRRASRQ
jgi:hypothetical protein